MCDCDHDITFVCGHNTHDKCYCNEDMGCGYTYHDEYGECDFCLCLFEEGIKIGKNKYGESVICTCYSK
jgi:hypothetical protein